ncbi:MAG: hypothetical protein OEW58_02115 [Gammaproteobacteria bacterium]|nr:hypothetical protein [Gammaproteobacteria bacterium]
MLEHILRAFFHFEKVHGEPANVLDISHEHYQMLQAEYPQLFGAEREIELGFHICLHSSRDQTHPSVRKMVCWHERRQPAYELLARAMH